jgi:hypothetical protein
MGIFNKLKEPVFLKESSNAEIQIEKLRALQPLLNEKGQSIIKQDIKFLEYGMVGEKTIAFELKNSHIPMYILHDIYLEEDDLNAQIDYLVFTRKLCFVIECKNLYGNIEINNSGHFIRTMEYGRSKKKEGIYSPITQNQRHLELMKKIKTEINKNILMKFMAGNYFEDFNKSVVVLANPKTVLNAKYAKKEVKEKVIRSDQLVKYIKDMYNNSKNTTDSDKGLLAWAQSYLCMHKSVEKDYTTKYEQYRVKDDSKKVTSSKVTAQIEEKMDIIMNEEPVEETDIFKELKKYRLDKSRKEKIKPYFIYNDKQLNDLISKMPINKAELKKVAGFGEVKTNKYGDDVLRIVGKYSK